MSTILVIGGVRGIGEIGAQGGQSWSRVQGRKKNNRINEDDDECNRNEDEKKEKKQMRKKENEKAEMAGEQFKGGIVWKAILSLDVFALFALL